MVTVKMVTVKMVTVRGGSKTWKLMILKTVMKTVMQPGPQYKMGTQSILITKDTVIGTSGMTESMPGRTEKPIMKTVMQPQSPIPNIHETPLYTTSNLNQVVKYLMTNKPLTRETSKLSST